MTKEMLSIDWVSQLLVSYNMLQQLEIKTTLKQKHIILKTVYIGYN